MKRFISILLVIILLFTSLPLGSSEGDVFGKLNVNSRALGKLIKASYGGRKTQIGYNPSGLKKEIDDADMGVWRYSYDTWGNLLNQTDARGKVITMSYDSFSRLKAKTTTEGIVSYSYDEAGRRTGMVDQSGETEWTYDKRGRLIQEEKTVLGNQYRTVWVYNNADQVTQMIYPSKEKVKYTYLPQGNLRGVGNYQWDLKTDEHNRVKEKSLFDGNKITYSYYGWLENSGGTLKNITAFKGSNNILEFRYQYDELGNVSQIKDCGNAFQTQSFEYDQLNRLVSAETDYLGEGNYEQTYSYDPGSGNLKNHSELGDYTYNALHPHAVETAGGYSYTYDENGNATSRTVNGQTESYMYDSENRLIEIESQNGSLKKYLYDGDGNRVARLDANNEGTIFIGNYFESEYPWIEDGRPPIDVGLANPGDTSLCEAETENCAYLPVLAREANLKPFPVKRGTSYYYADGQRIAMRTGGEAHLLFGDHLGSSSLLVRADGTEAEKGYYLPWGGERGDTSITSTDYGYTGQMREGDIYYYGARYYDPAIGRFMQADTIVPLQVQGTQAFDRYAYVNNNPMKYVDPSGNLAITTAILIGSAVVGGLASYGWQVYQNMEYGLDFKEALTTDINIEQIVGTAITTAFVASIGIDVVSIASGAIAAFKAVCADGDCTNEIQKLTKSGLETVDDIANSELGKKIARTFTHNPNSSVVSIGGNPYYQQVGDQMNYTYFNMSDKAWSTIETMGPNVWRGINTAFMNEQMLTGKSFVTVINPLKLGPGYLLEKTLLENSGYIQHIVSKYSGFWRLK